MAIQVFKQLRRQRAYALGEVARLRRKGADDQSIREVECLVRAIELVMNNQGVDEPYLHDAPKERTPKRKFFPRGAYRRDTLRILREAGRPLRIRQILHRLCELHAVQLGPKDLEHAAIKLAQANYHLMRAGFVQIDTKEGEHRSAACTYALRQRR